MIIFALEGGTICARMENGSVRKALAVLGLILALFVMLPEMSNATVLLIGNNKSFTFDDLEANFVPPTKGSGLCGMLQVAEPSDACSPLRNKAVSGEGLNSPFALIQRGTCSFERKVRHAQDAGFKAAIVYNNEDNDDLVTTSIFHTCTRFFPTSSIQIPEYLCILICKRKVGGNSRSLMIYAVFVSKADGQILLRYAGNTNMECWIIPSLNTSWTVMVISFSALISMAALLAICVFLRKYWLRHGRRVNSHRHQLPAMSCRQVKALPSLIFISVTDDKCTSETCAICLEDYKAGEKLRVLPCCHKFHALCIDSWLTRWRTFCPVCKRDAKTVTVEPPVTENTPLLSASSLISSQSQAPQSSFIGSPSMHVPPISLLPESLHSHSSHIASSYMAQTLGSHDGFSNLSRNVANIGNTSLVSLGIQSSVFSSQSSLCASPQMDSSFTLPQQMDSSFTLPQPILSCGGSVAVISPFNSTNSLPGYQECCV